MQVRHTRAISAALDSEPASSVVLDLVSGDVSAVTMSPASLTFTPSNWNTPQAVTVTGVDDAVPAGDRETRVTVSVDPALSDPAYGPAVDRSVMVTTLDDDEVGFVVTETNGETVVTEDGGTDTLTVVLRTRPSANVLFLVTASDPTEATVSPATLTFMPTNWNEPQIVIVTGVDDDLMDGPQTSTVSIAVDDANSAAEYQGLPGQSVTVTTLDNDMAGLVLADTTALQVTEGGGIARFTVALSSQPASPVVVTLTSMDLTEVTVSPASLTFESGTWNVPQTVTLTGIDDVVVDGNTVTSVVLAVQGGSDPEFTGARVEVSVTNVDNDAAGITLGGNTSPTVTEGGGSEVFTVRLNTQPPSNVVVGLFKDSNGDRIAVSPSTVTFTNANWATPQDVTVTAVDNDLVDGDVETQVLVAVNQGQSDEAYHGVPTQEVDVSVMDNDVAGFTVSETALSVEEGGVTDTFTVRLDPPPVDPVILTITDSPGAQVVFSDSTLTFTSGNWDSPQTVTVTAIDDDVVEDPHPPVELTVAVAAGSDAEFSTVPDQDVTVSVTDNNVAGFALADTTGLAVGESPDSTDTFTVVLTSRPSTGVTLNVVSGDTDQATVTPSSVLFTPDNWNVPQTVTVAGVDDGTLVDGDQEVTLTVSVAAGSDGAFTSLAPQTTTVTALDENVAGFTLSETALSVTEGGVTDAFTVLLDAQPVDPVILTITDSPGAQVLFSDSTLTFTSGNWDLPHTVTVTAIDDDLARSGSRPI